MCIKVVIISFIDERKNMKTCPMCNSSVFEDIDRCYNCLYEFKNNEKEIAYKTGQKSITDLSLANYLVSYYEFLGAYLKRCNL